MNNIKEVVVEKSDWNNMYNTTTVKYDSGKEVVYYPSQIPLTVKSFIRKAKVVSQTMKKAVYR